ncbi:MAG: invasion associated locus B family protein [Alphaproteobacteria bacterium]
MRILRIAATMMAAASVLAGCGAQQAAPFVIVLPVAVELALAEATKDAREIGRFGTWTAAQAGYPGRRSCFVSAAPSSTTQLPTRIGDAGLSPSAARGVPGQRRKEAVALVVAHRNAVPVRDEVSFRAGWELAAGRDATITVDGRQMAPLARRTALEPEIAYMRDAAGGRALVAALREGKRLEVASVGPGNAANADSYDLSGFAAAHDAANAACGVR